MLGSFGDGILSTLEKIYFEEKVPINVDITGEKFYKNIKNTSNIFKVMKNFGKDSTKKR